MSVTPVQVLDAARTAIPLLPSISELKSLLMGAGRSSA